MNGYEFTRMENNFTKKMKKARCYEASVVAFQIDYNNPYNNFREDDDYKDAKDWFIETTMSCNTSEAVDWMKYYMANAIAYGIVTKNLDWMTKFLAAYDLFVDLTDGEFTASDSELKFAQTC